MALPCRTALVTGGSSGLGLAFVQMLLHEGLEVWSASRNPQSSGLQHPRLHPVKLDLTAPQELDAFCHGFFPTHPIDLLINNAGAGLFGPFDEMDPAHYHQQLALMLEAPIRLCRAAWPFLKERRGIIVNVASLAASFPLPYMSAYNAAKAGLSAFSRSLQQEAEGTGLTVIDFQPGDFRTAFNTSMHWHAGGPQAAHLEACRQSLERHMAEAPLPARAAADLRRALQKRRSGLIRTGGFFQAQAAPLLARFASWRFLSWILKQYWRP